MSDKRSYIALEWVSREIEETLNQAADSLEGFIKNVDDITKLRFCLTYIHQVAGSLKMIELYGAALLCEEIEQVLTSLQKNEVPASSVSLSVSELLKAMRVLVAYVNQVNASGEDDAKQLLPSLNAVRALNPEEADNEISEADIFNPNISHARAVDHKEPEIAVDEFNELIRKLRQSFQKGLVGIVRSQNLDDNYGLLCKVSSALYKTSKNTASEPLWKIAFAITELLQKTCSPAELESKKALSLLDKEIKKLEQDGTNALAELADAGLLKTLLYSVATATISTPLIDELRESYNLNEALSSPSETIKKSDQAINQNRELTSSSREKLEEIKELFVECVAAQWDSSIIRPVPRLLASLDKSFEGTAFTQLQPYIQAAKSFIEVELLVLNEAPQWQIIESYADIISSLDYYLECAHAESEKKLSSILQGTNESLKKLNYQLPEDVSTSIETAVAESKVDNDADEDEVDEEILEIFTEEAAEVIENINDFLPKLIADTSNHEALTELRRGYHTLKGSGRMVKAFIMGDFAWSIERMINRVLDGEAQVTSNSLSVLQEATAYIPTMLDCFENKIAVDRVAVDAIIAKADAEWRGESSDSKQVNTVEKLEDEKMALTAISEEVVSEEVVEDEIDEEILEIFTEEAAEVLENIQEFLPQLKVERGNLDALAELRRSYHTLKGSGRMVKAFVMGDFAWSVERMMNKIMDGNAEVTDNCIAVLEEATNYIPAMLSAFENKTSVDKDVVNSIIAKANAEWEGNVKPAADVVDQVDPLGLHDSSFIEEEFEESGQESVDDPETLTESLAVDDDPLGVSRSDVADEQSKVEVVDTLSFDEDHAEEEIDEEILEIFTEEAAEVLENIHVYLPKLHDNPEDQEALAELRRAYHTLKGSGRMVKAFVVGDFAWSVERMINKIMDGHAVVTTNSLQVLTQATAYIPIILSAFENHNAVDRAVVDALIAKADAEWEGRAEVQVAEEYIDIEDSLEVDNSNEILAVDDEHEVIEFENSELVDSDFELEVEINTVAVDDSNEFISDEVIVDSAFDGQGIISEELDLSAISDLEATEESLFVDTDLEALNIDDDDEEESSELAEIFAAEAESCIQEFLNYLDKIDPGYEDVEVTDDLQRTFHTLKGSAYMAGVTAMAELVTPLESLVRDLSSYQVKADTEILAVFMQAAEILQQQLKHLKQGTLVHTDVSLQFIDDVNALHALRIEIKSEDNDGGVGLTDNYSTLLNEALECLTNASELLLIWRRGEISSQEKQELIANVRKLSETAASANYSEVADLSSALANYYVNAANSTAEMEESFFVLADKAADELDDMFDMVAAHQTVEAADEVIKQLQQVEFINIDSDAEDIVETETDESESNNAIDAAAIIETETDKSESNHAIDTDLYQKQLELADEDTLEIFIEEANEIMEELDTDIQAWLAQHDGVEKLPEIKRSLHTLKGGARLTELGVLGDLTHEYESVIEATELTANYTADFFSLIELYQEQMQCLVDFATDGNPESLRNIAGSSVAEKEEISGVIEELEVPSNEVVEDNTGLPCIDLEQFKSECAGADEETLEIFIEEAQELTTALESSVNTWLEDHSQVQETAELKRVLHTLKGGARLSELPSLGDLTHNYESMIESAELNAEYNETFFVQLKHYLDLVQQMVDCILSLDSESTQESASQNMPLESVMDITANPADKVRVAQLVPELTGVDEVDDVDDVLQLFLEEAKEQTEGIDECIAELQKDQANAKPLEDIKRLLHTLKGGARLAEQTAIGDLSHDFETYIINAERDNKHGDDVFVEKLQGFHEQLNQKLDVLKPNNEALKSTADNVVPIRSDIDVDEAASQVTQAAVDATKNFIESFNQKQQQKRSAQEPVKVAPDLLDNLINLAGENSIGRSRVEEQVNDLAYSVDEMDVTVDRLHGQLRRLEIETEAQIVFRQEQVENEGIENFDPLEMDRYSQMQQLSKSLVESASDLDDISATFTNQMRDMETLLVQQGRINTELQEGLMRCQMVPFSRMVPRLRRIIRQVASELGKKVEFNVENAEGELDRTILERMIAPLEHMLRNAVDHGIEMPDIRKQAGKDDKGRITLVLSRDGGEVVLTLKDNGAGVNLEAVRNKAIERGLMDADTQLSNHEICQFILHAGFSTAATVTQISGRGVGMDVVHSEIKQMGGSLEIYSEPGQGSEFVVRLPFTVSVNRALMVTVGNDTYALPLNTIEGIVRVSPYELEAYYQPDAPMFEYAGQSYNLRYMGGLLQRGQQAKLEGLTMPLPVILIRSNEYTVAVQVDKLLGSQEVVVKTLGPQFSMVEGLNGATVLGDGSVVIILDMLALIRADASRVINEQDVLDAHAADIEVEATRVMVVDDSVTVRKVTSRLLERYGLEVILAKDGLDAVTQLQEMEQLPDVMLLDIEMPRMDGFEVVSRVRHNEKLEHIPICMITSRTGDKHRERALSLGANDYLGKPFQERELLQTISRLTGVEVLQS